MGKGDQRTRRGKLYRGTFGKSRPHSKKNKGKTVAAKARVAPRRAPAAAPPAAPPKKVPRKSTPPSAP